MVKQPIITVKNLVKNYGDFNAVQDISFEVFEGEIFGLLGPNGAGKTTTLEIIETLRDKTSGEITVDGFDIEKDAADIKKRIGVQLQAAGYYPNLNLSELIKLFCGLYGIDKSPMEMLQKVALTDKAKAKYKDLSGGQKQRFSIATTLINNPRIIFLDEPTVGVDVQSRHAIMNYLLGLNKKGTTLIYTSHQLNEAEDLCKEIALLDNGKIVKQGNIDELLKDHHHESLEALFLSLTGKNYRDDV